ncbi:hypothetical protein LguiB_030497 [Lonicera macranthoides]
MVSSKSINVCAEIFQKVSLPSLQSTRNNKTCTKSEATRETEALAHLIENAGTSSSNAVFLKSNRSFKAAGGRGRAKSKFSFHFQPQRDLALAVKNNDETQLLSKVLSLHEDLEPIENRAVEHSMSELLELFQGEKIEHSEIDSVPAEVAVGHDHAKPSAAELPDCFLKNNVLLGGNSITHSRTKGERAQVVVKRNICPLGDRNIDEDGSCEAFDSGPSSGDEDDHKNIKHTIPESKQKTMTDQFQEAFGISSKNDEGLLFTLPRHLGIGLFGKLQRVMQSEKEREMEFLRRLPTKASLTDGSSCIDVRILSKCLEAKLTVCGCSFIRDEEGSQCVDNSQMRKEMGRDSTIIFSPRTCSDVELEAGKLIRIHPPWKEICVTGKDEKIILSTYFSQILT